MQETQKMYFPRATVEILERATNGNFPVLLIGDTGTGKTSLVRELANQKKRELIRLNLTGQTGVDEILGKWLASPTKGTFWLDGLLITAMRKGYWIVLDEINMALPEILSALHSLLDDDRKVVLKEKDGEIIKCHPEFRFFATMNPSDEYVGTKELNKAFLSRFPIVLDVDYSTQEIQILQDRAGITKEDAEVLVSVGKEMRHSKIKNLITCACSTRDLIYASQMMALGLDMPTALQVAIVNKAPREERKPIAKIIELLTNKKLKMEGLSGTYKSVQELLDAAKEQILEFKRQAENAEERRKDYENEANGYREKTNDLMTKVRKFEEKEEQFESKINVVRNSVRREKAKNTRLNTKVKQLEKKVEVAKTLVEEKVKEEVAKICSTQTKNSKS